MLRVPGLGLATTVQAEPFQCSVSPWRVEPMRVYPTAQTSVGEIAANPTSALLLVPAGFGLGITSQLAPFQCSTSVL